MQGEVALAYFCVLLIVGGWCKRKENARWSAVGGVGGTLCQCVNDPGEDDWWLVAGGVPEPSSPRGRGLPALRVVVTLFSVHPPATLAEINDNGNTAAVGAIILVQVSASGHVTSLLVQGVVPPTQCSASMINDAMVKCLHLE